MSYFNEDKYIDIDYIVKKKKVISDILTVKEAIKCHKSSKNHKLVPRKNTKTDRTHTKESKARSKIINARN